MHFLKTDLLEKIDADRNDKVHSALDYAEQLRIRFDIDFLGDLLTRVIRQGTDRQLVERLRGLIRRASIQ